MQHAPVLSPPEGVGELRAGRGLTSGPLFSTHLLACVGCYGLTPLSHKGWGPLEVPCQGLPVTPTILFFERLRSELSPSSSRETDGLSQRPWEAAAPHAATIHSLLIGRMLSVAFNHRTLTGAFPEIKSYPEPNVYREEMASWLL